jgi:hypothetical protein
MPTSKLNDGGKSPTKVGNNGNTPSNITTAASESLRED